MIVVPRNVDDGDSVMAKTVMIVDDSPTMRQMVRDVLLDAGYAVVEGKDGKDALGVVGKQPVQLVITDFNMPVMNGISLVKELRSLPEHRFTPILMLTTEHTQNRKDEGRAAGATGWIVKPFDPSRLLQIVARLVP
jgi:two-component system, chemotaxis family, chemotaxis protein CheY